MIGVGRLIVTRVLGRPGLAAPSLSNVAFIETLNSTGSDITVLPATTTGDFLLCTACRTTDSAVPVLPSGEGWISPADTADVDPTIAGPSAAGSGRLAYKFPTVSAEASAGWTNAQSLIAASYSGVHATVPILSAQWNFGTDGDVVWPALTHNDPLAWVILWWRTSGAASLIAPPTGFVSRSNNTRRGLVDSGAPMQTFAGASATPSAAAGKWVAGAIAAQSS